MTRYCIRIIKKPVYVEQKRSMSINSIYMPKLSIYYSSEKTLTNLVTLKECDKADMIAFYNF